MFDCKMLLSVGIYYIYLQFFFKVDCSIKSWDKEEVKK
jgi:hypothetical protein